MDLAARTLSREEFTLLESADYEELPCNLCGRKDFEVLGERDGVGLPVRTVLCSACGLILLNPRLTKAWYEKYYAFTSSARRAYKHGSRNLRGEVGSEFNRAVRHGQALTRRLGSFLKLGLTIDVGSAEGGLLAGMRALLPIEPLGIEPHAARAEFATRKGIPTHAALIENIQTAVPDLPPAVNVVCTKSLNHFLDPKYFFSWAHRTLGEDGRLLLEVKNFRQQCRMSGRIQAAVQIDHPFMFVPETLEEFVRAAGFEIIAVDVDEGKSQRALKAQKADGLPVKHVRLVARKANRAPFSEAVASRPGVVRRLRREFSPLRLYAYYLINHARPIARLRERIGAIL